MNEKIKPEQKNKLIVEALGIAGFEENPDFPGIYTKEHGEDKIVLDMTAGKSIYFLVNKQKVVADDATNTLAKVSQMIMEAEDGQMPSRTTPDIVVDVPKPDSNPPETEQPTKPEPQINGVDFNVDPDTWPEGWDPSMGAKPTKTTEHAPTEIVHSTAPPAPFMPKGTMIKGLVPGLKEIGKIKIGRKGATKTSHKGTSYRPPEKFDHFEVVTLYKDENGDFKPDAAVMGLIGDDCKELDVSLLYNDPTLNFFTRYNQYKGGKCMCSGDGELAVKEDGTELVCNPDTCLLFKTKKCKANGILSVILKDSPRLGGVYKFRTTSFNSIRSILSSLFFIQSLTGGVLADIPLKMTVSPQSVNPVGSPTAQTIYVVNLEYPGNMEDLQKHTIELMTRKAGMQSKIVELEAQARVAITAAESKEEIQDVEAEFYPAAEEVST
jgi:hypothetical protein